MTSFEQYLAVLNTYTKSMALHMSSLPHRHRQTPKPDARPYPKAPSSKPTRASTHALRSMRDAEHRRKRSAGSPDTASVSSPPPASFTSSAAPASSTTPASPFSPDAPSSPPSTDESSVSDSPAETLIITPGLDPVPSTSDSVQSSDWTAGAGEVRDDDDAVSMSSKRRRLRTSSLIQRAVSPSSSSSHPSSSSSSSSSASDSSSGSSTAPSPVTSLADRREPFTLRSRPSSGTLSACASLQSETGTEPGSEGPIGLNDHPFVDLELDREHEVRYLPPFVPSPLIDIRVEPTHSAEETLEVVQDWLRDLGPQPTPQSTDGIERDVDLDSDLALEQEAPCRVTRLLPQPQPKQVRRQRLPNFRFSFDFAVSDRNGSSIPPTFYPGAPMPIHTTLDRPIDKRFKPQLKSIVVALVTQPGQEEEEEWQEARREEWHPCDVKRQRQSLSIKMPSSRNAPVSHDGLFTIKWILRLELHVLVRPHHGKETMCVASCARGFTVLPSTSPTPPRLYGPVRFAPKPHYPRPPRSHQWLTPTMRTYIETSTISPNSIIPLTINFRLPSPLPRLLTNGDETMDSEQAEDAEVEAAEEEEEGVSISARLVRQQRVGAEVCFERDISTIHSFLDVDRPLTLSLPLPLPLPAPGPSSASSSSLSLSRYNTTPAARIKEIEAEAEGEAFEVDHRVNLHLPSYWAHGYSLLTYSQDTMLSNGFYIDITATHVPSNATANQRIPFIIGSVAEPRDALYRIALDPSIDDPTSLALLGLAEGTRPGYSNEKGWKVAPPSYQTAITQPAYQPGDDWLKYDYLRDDTSRLGT